MHLNERIRYWVHKPVEDLISQNVLNLATAPGVRHVAVMPDIHLSKKICNGVAIACEGILFPEAVGGDIGCGYLMADVDGSSRLLRHQRRAKNLLQQLNRSVPIIRHSRDSMVHHLPNELSDRRLSTPILEKLKSRDARVQFGTLGRGNHFVEFQVSDTGSLHVLIHSGSRAVGPAILAHHLQNAMTDESSKLRYLESASPDGEAYLSDMQWARDYAAGNRRRMLELVGLVINEFGLSIDNDSAIDRDHNHVQLEIHRDRELLVHRKGTQRLENGQLGIIPGSMGTSSFLVTGRESSDALQSCSHGAGRRLSRTEAHRRISARDLKSQMKQVLFDDQKTHRLRDEAPAAYKDIRKVMRAQKELVRVQEERTPILNFKSG